MEVNKELNRTRHLSDFRYDIKNCIYILPEQKDYTINYSDGFKTENYILQSLKKAKDIKDDSEELMKMARDWPSYYHLGIERSNILKALNLPSNAKVLELGSGCGALTRYLGEKFESVDGIEGSSLRAQIAYERCRDLENVRIFASNFKYIKFFPAYDIVTLIGVLEYAPIYFLNQHNASESCLSLLKLAKTALKENGILIIAIENKIGIKYWSGCPDDHTGKFFNGIQGYTNDQSPITFSKKEIEALLKIAGFSNISFYHCFPDYKFASTIISDVGNEKDFYLHNWVKIPFISYKSPRIYTFHEGLAIKTLSESGLLREFANSFLIVAGQNDSHILSEPDWIAKRFSIKRRKNFRCITTLKLKPKIYIKKEKLFYDHEDYIEKDDIKIKHKIADSSCFHIGNLMIFDVYKVLFEENFNEKILGLLKTYYQEIVKRYYIGLNDEEGYPLLQGNSIDFIFRNIIKQKNNLLAIDNEWCVEKYISADYLMYRCIVYDIVSQNYWVRKRTKNTDKFTIYLMKYFFPNYSNRRNNKNILLEKSFQNVVVGNSGEINFVQKKYFLNNKIVWSIIKKIWSKLPENIKFKIKKFV